ncbi:MAG: aminotransferase class V-fold PLP-dependent enzyme, partial [Actinomycetota bacterium]
MTFDVGRVRALYPALADGYAYLDGAAGTQVPGAVIEAVAGAYRGGIGNVGGAFPASGRSGAIVAEARRAVADLVGGAPDGVVLGPNMTTLTYRLAAALSAGWAPGDEVVVSRLDHDANVRPWVQAAARVGAVVRWAEVDLATGELPAGQYQGLVGERTRLVAVSAASNVLGTRPDVAAIAAVAHAAGALTYVDGVHATGHGPVDAAALGADFYAASAYKWSGPHVGAVVADPALADGYAYLDGAAGTQVPAAVVEAIAGAYRAGIGNVGGAFPASGRSGAIVAECRRAVADLVGGKPDGVVLGPNMTTLTYRLAAALAAGWGPGDEVVVSRL